MKKTKRNIEIKTALLMLVFLLNTLVGYSCSLDVKMVYNQHHHKQKVESIPSMQHHTYHNECKEHRHSTPSNSSNYGCCLNGVIYFNQPDKTVSYAVSMVHPVFTTAFVVTPFQVKLLHSCYAPADIRAFAQSYHPPIPDIRISIQSFLI